MASSKRENPVTEEQKQAKRAKSIISAISQPIDKNLRVGLNPADCNLDFNIEGDGLLGHALCEQGFAYCWSGARANVGISGGKYCFGCKIISDQPVDMEDTPSSEQHVCRVGISRGDDAVGSLGETEHSYGFGGTGKISNARRFSDYGEKFGVGDTIVCIVDLESKPWASIGFSKNGKWLGIANHFDAGPNGLALRDLQIRERQCESAVFPHVLLKNVVVQMQFSIEDGLVPEIGYKPWACAIEDQNAIVGPTFSDPTTCEVIMMVGLPASGKTTWAEQWVKEHPEKRYILLGTNMVLDQMKVPGLLRKNNYSERFDRLMDRATRIFNTLLSRAAKTPRNYILDQTNVYKTARKRKLKPFAIYHKIAVVIFPKPEELKVRAEKDSKKWERKCPLRQLMRSNFVLPLSKDMHATDEYFDQVWFPELNRAESQRCLDDMKCALADASTPKLKSGHSLGSRESSIHSDSGFSPYSLAGSMGCYYRPSLQGQVAASVTSVTLQGSHVAQLQSSYEYQRPTHLPGPYAGPGQPGRLESVSGAYHGHINSPPAPYYGNYPSWRHDTETRVPGTGRRSEPCHDYGISGFFTQPDAESRNFGVPSGPDIYRNSDMGAHYQVPLDTGRNPYPYGSHVGYASNSVNAMPDFLPPRAPGFHQSTFPGPYGSSSGISNSSLSSGNFPLEAQQFRGSPYGPPHPRYY
ncbi:hypothetical protein Ancab_007810 [Ancistrocladus abbreviatus]